MPTALLINISGIGDIVSSLVVAKPLLKKGFLYLRIAFNLRTQQSDLLSFKYSNFS